MEGIKLLWLQNHSNCHFLLNWIKLKPCNNYLQAIISSVSYLQVVSILGFPSEALSTSGLQARHFQLLQAGLEELHHLIVRPTSIGPNKRDKVKYQVTADAKSTPFYSSDLFLCCRCTSRGAPGLHRESISLWQPIDIGVDSIRLYMLRYYNISGSP